MSTNFYFNSPTQNLRRAGKSGKKDFFFCYKNDEKKLILDLSKQPPVSENISKLSVCQKKYLKGGTRRVHDNQSFTLLNTLASERARANLSNYVLHAECTRILVIFILLYLCCVCGGEICVCLLCLIFVNSFS